MFKNVADNFSKIRFWEFVANAKKRFFTTAEFGINLFFVDFVEIGILKSLTLPNFTILVRKPYSRKIENREIAKNIVSAKKSVQNLEIFAKKRVLKSLTLRNFVILGR